ncbi:hypothetical protein TURU_095621 [Turdus rufiventris]|nr:hypothetical protein TURU_095621 [Turdus rufiventris]
MGHGASTPTIPSRNGQLCSSINGSVKPICTPRIPRTAPWGRGPWVALAIKAWKRDPWVAFAVKVGKHPLIVWAVCRLHNGSDDLAICLPFWVDTGSDVTVIPDIHWPLPWKLEEAPMVSGVGGLSRARKSTQLIAITLCTERGPGRTITLTTYVMSDCPPLLGRDALALLDVRVMNLF